MAEKSAENQKMSGNSDTQSNKGPVNEIVTPKVTKEWPRAKCIAEKCNAVLQRDKCIGTRKGVQRKRQKFQRSLRRYEKGSRAGAGAAHGQRLGDYVRECGEQLPRRRTLCTARAFLRCVETP